MNKAQLFDNEVKTEGQLSVPKIVNVLVEFRQKMEATLVEMWKLLPRLQPEPIQLPISSPKGTPLKNRATMDLKTPLQHCPSKEPIAKVQKVVTLASPVQVKLKMTEMEPNTPKMMSSDLFPQRISTRKKKKEPTPDSSIEMEEEGSFEEVEEVEMVSSSEEPESEEEEAEPETLLPKKTKLKTWTSEQKKSILAFKTLGSSKRLAKEKMPKKGESS